MPTLSRVKEAILPEGTIPSGAEGAVDPTFGGQFGWSPRIGVVGEDGQAYSEWISNQAYVQNNVIPVLIQGPKMFDYMEGGEKLLAILKSLIELRSKTIEGLTATKTVEVGEHNLGGGGQVQQEIVNVTIATSNVTHTYQEVQGKGIHRFFDMMIDYGGMDPYTKHSKIGTLDKFDNAIWTPEFFTFTVLYIEPDVTGKRVVDAYLRANMFPLSSGEVNAKRDLNAAKEMPEMSIEFTGFNMRNDNVLELAQSMLNKMNLARFDSAKSPLFVSTDAEEAIDPAIRADKTPVGVSDLPEE